jgi:hypothetical protein
MIRQVSYSRLIVGGSSSCEAYVDAAEAAGKREFSRQRPQIVADRVKYIGINGPKDDWSDGTLCRLK